jgi:hypothetical protein
MWKVVAEHWIFHFFQEGYHEFPVKDIKFFWNFNGGSCAGYSM